MFLSNKYLLTLVARIRRSLLRAELSKLDALTVWRLYSRQPHRQHRRHFTPAPFPGRQVFHLRRPQQSQRMVSLHVQSLLSPSLILDLMAPNTLPIQAVPAQPNIVNNCDAFYFVRPGDSCDAIDRAHGIAPAQFLAWNPALGAGCSGLCANAYACASIIGVDPTSTPTPTSTTPLGNGVATPLPTQSNMINNCNKFHLCKATKSVQQLPRCIPFQLHSSLSGILQ